MLIFCATALTGVKEIWAEAEKEPLSAEEETFIPKVEYKPQSPRDPFQGYVIEEKKQEEVKGKGVEEGPVSLPGLKVEGIIWGSQLPQAIINNEVVRPGDSVEGVQIIEISRTGLTVLFKDKIFKLDAPSSSSGGRDEK